MDTPNSEIPVTFDMLLDAIYGVGDAYGIALHAALDEMGLTPAQHVKIARRLSALSSESARPGPDGHCLVAITGGFLKPLR